MTKAKKGSSRRWLAQHEADPYVLAARREGYRSRASYKFLELDRRYRILRPGQRVVDLGAAPGGWSQVAAERVGPQGQVWACDLLPMAPVPGVWFVQGDFTDAEVLATLRDAIGGAAIDVVISDMAPNISGMRSVDQPRAMYLVELALEFAREFLKPGGVWVAKVFQGEGSDVLLREVRKAFRQVRVCKPEASRAESREVYWVAEEFRGASAGGMPL